VSTTGFEPPAESPWKNSLMDARPARPIDAPEVVRLASVMFESMGVDATSSDWLEPALRNVRERLDDDLAVFVVDDPLVSGRLIASAAGTIAQRLPTPMNPHGRAGYVQWVCTDPGYRGQGLGRHVMTALLAWYEARDVRAIELHSTPMAESLYLSLGFGDSGPRALRRR
jgi:GNAT superfamily N-acetyltransferase